MKKLLLLFCLLLTTLSCMAHDFEVDGIYYKITSSSFLSYTVEVTYRGDSYDLYSNEYTGSVTIPKSVTYNDYTYNVTTIGKRAFRNCTGLTSVTIGGNVYGIRAEAFRNCSSLTSITIPQNVSSIDYEVFQGCSSLSTIIVDEGNTTFDSRDGCNAIIETISNTLRVGCKNTIIPNSVACIGSGAFIGCNTLTSIEIPNSVTSIEGSAFEGCSNLSSINIPSSVTAIGTYAFEKCTSLSYVTLPNTMTRIREGIFSGCTGLTSAIIPSRIDTFENYVFEKCSGLKNVYCYAVEAPIATFNTFTGVTLSSVTLHVPDGSVDNYEAANIWSGFGNIVPLNDAFKVNGIYYNITSSTSPLTVAVHSSSNYTGSVTIPESVVYNGKSYTVTSIDDGAFENCTALTAVTIPSGITTIGKNVFSGCTALTSVTINSNAIASVDYDYESESYKLSDYFGTQVKHYAFGGEVKRIGNNVGEEFDEVETVIIGNGVIEIGYDVFYRCQSLKSVTIGNEVETIGDGAFAVCPSLESVTLGNKVSEIGEEAFCVCPSLTSLFIPASVAEIGEWAFADCGGLESIVVEAGNPTYDSRNNCNALIETESNTLLVGCANTNIPKDIESISEEAFGLCHGLKSVTIPASVSDIGEAAFYGCSKLEQIIVEEGNEVYDSRDNCNAIIETATNKLIAGCKNTTIPNSVTKIGDYALAGCTSLTSITIPNSVTDIGYGAFQDCSGLTSVTIPNSVTSIGGDVFYGCTGLTSVIIPNSVTSIGGYAFYGCTGLTSVTIPNSVTSIDGSAFYGCTGLSSVTIPNSVTSIGYYAFEDCTGLTSITIPNSVTSIDYYAFRGCTNLQSIYCLGETPAEMRYSFDEYTYEEAVLYVPYGSIDAYRNDTWGWGQFYDIREFDPTKVEDTSDIENSAVEKIYDLSGRSQQRMQRGINLIRMSNGKVRKIMVR